LFVYCLIFFKNILFAFTDNWVIYLDAYSVFIAASKLLNHRHSFQKQRCSNYYFP